MVAAVLYLQYGARVIFETVDELRRGFLHRHDVVDQYARGCLQEIGRVAPGVEFFLIADNAVYFGHLSIGFRLYLRGAAGNDDLGVRMFPPRPADRLTRLPHR